MTASTPRLTRDAAMILAVIQNGPQICRSRDLRHAMPMHISRRAFARAWVELVSAGLVPAIRGGGHR